MRECVPKGTVYWLVFFSSLYALPPLASPGIGLGEGEFFCNTTYSLLKLEEMDRTPMHMRETENVESFVASYGLTRDWSFIGVVPFSQKGKSIVLDGKQIHEKTGGVGDFTLSIGYRPLTVNWIAETLRLLCYAGVTFPTGEYRQKGPLGPISRPAQPGTGNYSLPLLTYFTYQTQIVEINAFLSYISYFKGHGYQFGDEVLYGFVIAPRLYPFKLPSKGYFSELLLELELDGQWADYDCMEGNKVGNSGGNTLIFYPGLRYNHKYFSLAVYYVQPLIQHLNKTETEIPLVLRSGSSFSVNFAARY